MNANSRGTMRKLMLILSTCVLSSQAAFAGFCDFGCSDWPSADSNCYAGWPPDFNIDLNVGFRKDKFDWSIAGVTETPEGELIDSPNILSELKWKDLRMAQAGGDIYYVSCRNYAIHLGAQYGTIYHGKVSDFDYAGDGRTGLFSLSRNKANGGHVYDLSAAAGYRITSTCNRFVALVLAGYSQHAQYLQITDGHQIFPINHEFSGLNSRYTTRWYGPWLGVDFEARVERCAYLFGSFELHLLAYRGHGLWNLRPDIGRFHHKANGQGYVLTLGGKWEIFNNWAIGVMGNYRMFRTGHGSERSIYLDPIEGPITISARFNGARWHTYSVSGTVSWRY